MCTSTCACVCARAFVFVSDRHLGTDVHHAQAAIRRRKRDIAKSAVISSVGHSARAVNVILQAAVRRRN